MNDDRQLEETLDRLSGSVDRSGAWASIEAQADARAGSRKGASAPRRMSGMRVAVFASVAVFLVAAITVGSLEAVKHLGNGQPILVITDQTTVPSTPATQPAATTTQAVTTTTQAVTTTTGLEGTTTTTEKLSTAETRLSNGHIKAMGFIDKVYLKDGKRYISIDYAEYLTGAAADAAAVAAGEIAPGEHVEDDYWIQNDNPQRTSLRGIRLRGHHHVHLDHVRLERDNGPPCHLGPVQELLERYAPRRRHPPAQVPLVDRAGRPAGSQDRRAVPTVEACRITTFADDGCPAEAMQEPR